MSFRYDRAVRQLLNGGIIGYPTEAVWGLGCDPWNESAVSTLLYLKSRPVEKGLILVGADARQFAWLTHSLSTGQRAKLELTWPGPTTWLVPHHGLAPAWICGAFDTVAIRVSAHRGVAELCRHWGGPLVSTSANPAGCQPATEAFQCRRYFGSELDEICSGRVGSDRRPSLIRDLMTDQIIRHG